MADGLGRQAIPLPELWHVIPQFAWRYPSAALSTGVPGMVRAAAGGAESRFFCFSVAIGSPVAPGDERLTASKPST